MISSAKSDAIRTPRFSRDTNIASNSGPARRSRTSPTSSVSSRSAANCAAVDSWRGTTRASGNFAVKRASARGSTSGSSSSGIPSLMTLPPSVVNSAIVASAWSRRASTARASARNVMPASVGRTPMLLRTNSLTANSRSRLFTVCDSAGWLTWRRREAADNPPSSTIATNAASSRNSMPRPTPPYAELIAAFELCSVLVGGPEPVYRDQCAAQAFGGERLEVGHRRIHVGHGELGGDEPRLQAGQRDGVRQPGLGVIPTFARGAGRVSASAAGEHDEVGAAKESAAGFGVHRQAWRDDVVHPGLDGARRAEVVQRHAEQHGVGVLDLVDQRDAERERRVLRGRARLGGHQSGRSGLGVEVRNRVHGKVAIGDRAAGVGGAPALCGASGQPAADGPISLHG